MLKWLFIALLAINVIVDQRDLSILKFRLDQTQVELAQLRSQLAANGSLR